MDISKATINLLRKRIKKQKRRTFYMFIIGLFLGGGLAFSLYYWYPLLEKEFGFKPINQIPLNVVQEVTEPSPTASSTETIINSSESSFVPRINFQNPVKISPVNQSLNEQLDQTISEQDISGTVLAIKNNQVVLLKNYGNAIDISADPVKSTYMMASIQKAITSILIMKLIEDNKLSLNTSLATFYPDIPNSDNITIDQMLSMTSGLGIKNMPNNTKTKEEVTQYVLQNVAYESTTSWRYTAVNFFLLATIIEKLSNQTYEDYFYEIIKKPLNLEHTGFYSDVATDKNSQLIPSHYRNKDGTINSEVADISESNYINEFGTGNMYTSAEDLATIIQARTDGILVSQDVLENTLVLQPENYTYNYKAGFYDSDSFYFGHGLFRGYEPSVYFSKDAGNIVVFLSNTYANEKANITLTESLFQVLNQN